MRALIIVAFIALAGCSDVTFESKAVSSNKVKESINLPAISGKIELDDGAQYSNSPNFLVEASLESVDANEVLLSENENCETGEYREMSEALNYEFSERKNYPNLTLYAKFRNTETGQESPCVKDDIFHDKTPPTVTINEETRPAELTNIQIAKIDYSATDGDGSGVDKVECAVDKKGEPTDCFNSSSHFSGTLQDGDHAIFVRARDKAGNIGEWQEANFEVDATPPGEFTIVGVATNSGNQNRTDSEYDQWLGTDSEPEAMWLMSHEAVKYEVSILSEDGSTKICETKVSIEQKLAFNNGECTGLEDASPYKVRVVAVDRADNKTAAKDFNMTVDITPPLITLSGLSNELRMPAAQQGILTVTDEVSGVKSVVCKVDGNEVACRDGDSLLIEGLAEGDHSISVTAVDNAGNSSSISDTFEVLPEEPPMGPMCYVKEIVQDKIEKDKLDILFVVDTSISLDGERAEVSKGIKGFIDQLDSNTDYNLGVLLGHGPNSVWSGKIYKHNDEPYSLPSSFGLANIQAAMDKKLKNPAGDGNADGGEAMFYSLQRALTERLTLNRSLGFFREDAALAVVFVSDENDLCTRYPGRYDIDFVPDTEDRNGVEGEVRFAMTNCGPDGPLGEVSRHTVLANIQAVQGNRPFIVSAIIYPENFPKVSENETGYGMKELVEELGSNGLLVDLNLQENIAPGLADIGKLANEKLIAITTIPLDHSPVKVESVKRIDTDGLETTIQSYTHNKTANQVTISAADAGNKGDKIKVDYCDDDTTTVATAE